MALPEDELARVKELLEVFCNARNGDTVRLEYHTRGNRVTLVESRPLAVNAGDTEQF